MSAGWLGRRRIALASCGSTNDEAARLARAGAAHGTVVVADEQTAGRGRDGRPWASPPGNVYLSCVLRPALPLADVPPLTLAVGIGACDAARAFGAPAQLKWPNDLYVQGRKLAGVLVEAQSQGGTLESVIVGVGVNLVAVPEPVARTAVALIDVMTLEGGPTPDRAPDRDRFVTVLLEQLERWIDRYVAGGLPAIVPAWRERMALGLYLRAGAHTGELAGLDLDGALLVRDAAGIVHRIRSGDVEVVGPLSVTTTMSQ